MSSLAKLKFVSSKQRRSLSPVQQRQVKLCTKLDAQLAQARAMAAGTVYTATVLRWQVDAHTGEKRRSECPKRVTPWFWQNEGAKWHLTVRYGSRVLEITRGRNAIELADLNEVMGTISLLKTAVMAGELDEAINTAVTTIKSRFKG